MDPSWLSQTYWEMRKMGNKKAHLCELKRRALTAMVLTRSIGIVADML